MKVTYNKCMDHPKIEGGLERPLQRFIYPCNISKLQYPEYSMKDLK